MDKRKFYEDEYREYKGFPTCYKKLVEYSVKFGEYVPLGFQQPGEEELAKAIKNNQPLRAKNDGWWY